MGYSDSSDEEKDSEDDEFRRKRQRRSKEDQMLGVFGSDSEDERINKLSRKSLHNKSVDFQKAGHLSSEDEWDERPTFARSEIVGDRASQAVSETSIPHRSGDSTGNKDVGGTPTTVPVFGAFQDASAAFVPSSNLPRSTQTVYADERPNKSQYKPPQKRNAHAGKEQAPSNKLMTGKAAQMMAKMGYKAGEGLGSSGKGIVNPIEAKLRPGQKAGLGSVSERTDQELTEEKRRGGRPSSDPQRPTIAPEKVRKQKIRYKTSKEIAEEAGGGLNIPVGLQTILDMTGGPPKLISSAHGAQSSAVNAQANESFLVYRSARQEVERLAKEWRQLQDRKMYLAAEHKRNRDDADGLVTSAMQLEKVIEQVNAIHLSSTQTYDEATKTGRLMDGLATLQTEFAAELSTLRLDEVAISLIAQHLKEAMASWDVLSDPHMFVDELRRLSNILQLAEMESAPSGKKIKRQSLPFENFMSSIWLPRIRTVLGSSWDPSTSSASLDLLDTWSSLTPRFIHNQIVDQLVMPRLSHSVRRWDPLRPHKKQTLSFLFQWLPFLAERVPDLVEIVKRKFVLVLNQWKPTDGTLEELYEWREILGPDDMDKMLVRSVLPKLADTLRRKFVIDPSDQNLEILELVLKWKYNFRPTVIGQLLETEFFPKWQNALYLWLVSDPNFEEISSWYEWWREVIPKDIHLVPSVRKGFSKGLEMMNHVLEYGPETLRAPQIGPIRPIDHADHLQGRKETAFKAARANQEEADKEISFKDVVEDWCAHQNLLILPLRKAHETGNSLYRITASAKGAKGVSVYFRGDIIMIQDRKQGSFLPSSLQDVLAALTP